MPIPALDAHGLLPAGTHDCTWTEIEERFCWNAHRVGLFQRLQDFISQEWLPLNVAAPMYVDGSFTRQKDSPQDIDLVVDVTHIPSAQVGPVILLKLEDQRVYNTYKIDFWVKHPIVPTDLAAFFCYTGVKAGAELGLDAKHLKGILRVNP